MKTTAIISLEELIELSGEVVDTNELISLLRNLTGLLNFIRLPMLNNTPQ